MHQVGFPAELAHGLDGAAHEEYRAFVIDLGPVHGLELRRGVAVEVVVVVDEVYLQARGLECGYLDDEGMVRIVDDDVHSRETDYFVKLIAAFVDGTVFGHKTSNFRSFFLKSLRKTAAEFAQRCVGQIGVNLLGDK